MGGPLMGGHLAHGPANRGKRVLETAAPLFVCEPDQVPRGGLVVVHGLFGLTHAVEAACRRLAADGWLTAAPFLYHSHGGPVFGEAARARAELSGLSLADLGGDVAAALAYLAGRGCLEAAVIGLGTGRDGFPPLATFAGGRGAPLLELPDGLAAGGPAADDPAADGLWRRVGAFLSEVNSR